MIHHIDFAVTDFARSREFYVLALAPLGLTAVMDIKHEDGRELTGFGSLPDPVLWIRKGLPISGRLHVAFVARLARRWRRVPSSCSRGSGWKPQGE